MNKNFFSLNDHPLIKHKMTLMRDKNTLPKEFKELLEEVTFIIATEASRQIPYSSKIVETPIEPYHGSKIGEITILPILRAGLGMLTAVQKLLPNSKIGFMGLKRDHDTLKAVEYYNNIPITKNCDDTVLVLDPMLATGNTVLYTLDYLHSFNIKNVIVISIISTPIGVEKILNKYPNCYIYSAALDEKLTDAGYITPGLGDAGDRLFNTL